MMSGANHKSSPSSRFLWYPVTSSLLGPNTNSATYPRTPTLLIFSLIWATKAHTHGKELAESKLRIFLTCH